MENLTHAGAPLAVGQRIRIDLVGLRARGRAVGEAQATATVVALVPGAVVVRLSARRWCEALDVTIGPARILSW